MIFFYNVHDMLSIMFLQVTENFFVAVIEEPVKERRKNQKKKKKN
jgi:hypothetical protein